MHLSSSYAAACGGTEFHQPMIKFYVPAIHGIITGSKLPANTLNGGDLSVGLPGYRHVA